MVDHHHLGLTLGPRSGAFVVVYGLAAILVWTLPSVASEFSPAPPAGSAWLVRVHYVMGTLLEIQLPGAGISGERLLASLFGVASRHDEIFSTFKPNSPVSRFNRSGSVQGPYRVPEEVIELASISQRLTAQTDGAFDITVMPLVRLWQEAAKRQRWTEADKIAAARQLVGAAQLAVDPIAQTVHGLAGGMELDFGGIAKGYCVDRMVELLHREGASNALINFGESSIAALGTDPAGCPWRVRVRDPQRPARTALTLRLGNMAIGSSASYEHRSKIAGRLIGHIINPRTGMPAPNDVAVTVIAPSATLADALSTALVVLPPVEGLKVVEKFPDTHAVIFYRSQTGRLRCLLSPGMQRYME
jgi:FAD:protein FMN transferase